MVRFMVTKSVHPKLRHDQIAKELGCSSSTLQRYRQDINMLSLYRIPPTSSRRKQNVSSREHDLDGPQMTSNDLIRPQLNSNDLAEPDTNTK